MKGQIIQISRIIDDNELVRGYTLVIETNELPGLKLGDCEVMQNG